MSIPVCFKFPASHLRLNQRSQSNSEQNNIRQSTKSYWLITVLIVLLLNSLVAFATPIRGPLSQKYSLVFSDELNVVSVTSSAFESPNSPDNVIDGYMQSRWSSEGIGQWIELDLGEVQALSIIKIAWYKGDERSAFFDVQASNDQQNWNTIYSGESSGNTAQLEQYTLGNQEARFIRVVSFGNTQNDWISILELGLFSNATQSDDISIQASDYQAPNIPRNILDGNLETRWAAEGIWQWVQLDFNEFVTVNSIEIAWFRGEFRQTIFEIAISSDGINWYPAFSGESGGTTGSFESYTLENSSPTKHLRIVGLGNSENEWISIKEVKLSSTETQLDVISCSAVRSQEPNYPYNTLDKDLTTRWAAQGIGQTIECELDGEHSLQHSEIAWYKGDERIAQFDIFASTDGVTWTRIFRGGSSGNSSDYEHYSTPYENARYIQIVGNGNSSNDWTSIYEVRFFGIKGPLSIRSDFKALVLHYNPSIVDEYGNLNSVSDALGMRTIEPLMHSYINSLRIATGGQVTWNIHDTFVLDEFPPEVDPNVTFSAENYLQYRGLNYDMLGNVDYASIINDSRFNIKRLVESGEIDAVWIFAFPGAGFWETSMAGNGAYYINGPTINSINTSKKFVVYGFGNEAHQHYGFMLENTGHMAENIIGNRAVDWPIKWRIPVWTSFDLTSEYRHLIDILISDSQLFFLSDAINYDSLDQSNSLRFLSSSGGSQIGTIHYPPNAMHNYGWSIFNESFDNIEKWQAFEGNWSLQSGKYSVGRSIDKGAKSFLYDYPDRPYAASDFTLEGDVSLTNDLETAHAGLLFRMKFYVSEYDGLGQGYYAAIDAYNDTVTLYDATSSMAVIASASYPIEPNTVYRLKVETQDQNIKIWIGDSDQAVLDVTDDTFTLGTIGVAASNTAAAFDNIAMNVSVLSNADKWHSYPNFDGEPKRLNTNDWGGKHEQYLSWWFEHLPKQAGTHDEGILNSWWPYIFDINRFDPDKRYLEIISAKTDFEAPATPESFGLLAVSSRSLTLAWLEPNDNIGVTRYDVYRNGVFLQQTSERVFIDNDVQPDKLYSYSLVARDGSGNVSEASSILVDTSAASLSGLLNGYFETGFGDQASYWTKDPWKPADSVLLWTAEGEGIEDSRAISIENTRENDARWLQTVTGLTPGTEYQLSGWVKGEHITNATGLIGANIGLFNTGSDSTNTILSGTFDWRQINVSFVAPEDGVIEVACRLGFYGSIVTGKAWFDQLSLTRVR